MDSRPMYSIAGQLNFAQLAIRNTLANPEIQGAVIEYGYTPEKMQQGLYLYDVAIQKVNARKADAGAQQQATIQVQEAQTDAWAAFQRLSKVARAILNKGELAALGLSGPMPHATAEFLQAGYTLFDNALEAVEVGALPLAEYGYAQERLESERAKIVAYDQANQAQEAAKGTAQQATQDQNAALEALAEWLAQFIKIARVALVGKEQLLEVLGVVVR